MLCSSFFALEQMIFYMAHEETTLALDSKEILQVHSALHGAVSAIIYFLTCYAQLPVSQCYSNYFPKFSLLLVLRLFMLRSDSFLSAIL